MEWLVDQLSAVSWSSLLSELVLEALVFFIGFVASWFLVVRRKLRAWQQLQTGESDDVIFQMHTLWPIPGSDGQCALLFRNVVPNTTVNQLYDNLAARQLIRQLADRTTLANPVLQTEGTEGFELVNTAIGHVGGHLATTPFDRQVWLFAMTCEDRQVVRKKCIRCFLIRPDDLRRFLDWHWCRTQVRVERSSHWFRIVALHCVARQWQREQTAGRGAGGATARGLVDLRQHHRRVQELSLGLNTAEIPVCTPEVVDWPRLEPELQRLGLQLASGEALVGPADQAAPQQEAAGS